MKQWWKFLTWSQVFIFCIYSSQFFLFFIQLQRIKMKWDKISFKKIVSQLVVWCHMSVTWEPPRWPSQANRTLFREISWDLKKSPSKFNKMPQMRSTRQTLFPSKASLALVFAKHPFGEAATCCIENSWFILWNEVRNFHCQ